MMRTERIGFLCHSLQAAANHVTGHLSAWNQHERNLQPQLCVAQSLWRNWRRICRVGSRGDKERAMDMLSSLTLYVDHHDAVLGAGVPSLLVSVKDERLVPQVSFPKGFLKFCFALSICKSLIQC